MTKPVRRMALIMEYDPEGESSFAIQTAVYKAAKAAGATVLSTATGLACGKCRGNGTYDPTPETPGCIRITEACPECEGSGRFMPDRYPAQRSGERVG